ncbi:RDD family protein [Mycobacterium sp. SMC-4]|uniref:RDD family protein n=1 Tax=Mycobacterium sp. SMC-4 TaxID=2857059 RepID=UPI0021B22887|nr:RDD family protein [Mycobacterium sp. SMC-4]
MALPKESYTPWTTRVLAQVIDMVPVVIAFGIGWGVLRGTTATECLTDRSQSEFGEVCVTGTSGLGQLAMAVATLAVFGYLVWNFGYRQGATGSSLGKSITRFRVVSEKTWQPIDFGLSILRQLAHVIDGAICYVGYLFPLWDTKRQTIADKIMTTVCVPL